jgi:alpha-tubulin suppressor-like RCC1 family protein
LWSWGRNHYGDLGLGHNNSELEPKKINSNAIFTAISLGDHHALALSSNFIWIILISFLEDGVVWSWGFNADGQLGLGHNVNQNSPQQIMTITFVAAISAGSSHSIALTSIADFEYHLIFVENGNVWSWGHNTFGQLGLGSGMNTNQANPVKSSYLTGITSISAGGWHTLALTRINNSF